MLGKLDDVQGSRQRVNCQARCIAKPGQVGAVYSNRDAYRWITIYRESGSKQPRSQVKPLQASDKNGKWTGGRAERTALMCTLYLCYSGCSVSICSTPTATAVLGNSSVNMTCYQRGYGCTCQVILPSIVSLAREGHQ